MSILTTYIKLAGVVPMGTQDIGDFNPNPQNQSGHLPSTDPATLTTNLLSTIIGLAGLGFIFYFMIGAINWITAGGDTNKAQTARTMIINALIGLVVTLIAYPVIQVLSQLLGVPLTNPAELFSSLFN